MPRRLAAVAAGAAAVLVALPGAALAADRNHDQLPDRWERQHGLSLHHKQGGRDQDHDGLRNRAEYRHRTDPRKPDSDRDGMKDGVEVKLGYDPRDRDSDDDGVRDDREGAGTVKAFDGTTLTIALAAGGELRGAVDAGTEVKCEAESGASTSSHGGDDGPSASSGSGSGSASSGSGHGSDDPSGDDRSSGGGGSDDPSGDDQGSGGHGSDDPSGDDHGAGGGHVACGTDALKPGAMVEHAEVHSRGDVAVFEEVELRS